MHIFYWLVSTKVDASEYFLIFISFLVRREQVFLETFLAIGKKKIRTDFCIFSKSSCSVVFYICSLRTAYLFYPDQLLNCLTCQTIFSAVFIFTMLQSFTFNLSRFLLTLLDYLIFKNFFLKIKDWYSTKIILI